MTYASTVLRRGFDASHDPLGGASRIPDGTDTDRLSDWMRNDWEGEGLPGREKEASARPGEALNTPGGPNREAVLPPVPDGLLINEVDADTPRSDSLEFIEVPEPGYVPRARRHRVLWFVAYLGWLKRAYRRGRELHHAEAFDVIHHATYAAYWLPTPVTDFGIPSVWGPVGGATSAPRGLWKILGWRGIISEFIDRVAVRLAARWPKTRWSWERVTVPIVQNAETLHALPASVQSRALLLNHVMFTVVPDVPPRRRKTHIVYFSALESRKGPRLAVHALAAAPDDVELHIVGDGPERHALERLSAKLGVSRRIRFLGRIPRDRAFGLLTEAAAVVFTGLREEGGAALAEAMLSGTPTIVLANGGPRTIAETAIDPSRVVLIEPGAASETARRLGKAMARFSRHPSPGVGGNLDQESARRQLRLAFERAMRRPAFHGLAATRPDAALEPADQAILSTARRSG